MTFFLGNSRPNALSTHKLLVPRRVWPSGRTSIAKVSVLVLAIGIFLTAGNSGMAVEPGSKVVSHRASSSPIQTDLSAKYGQLPLSFEPNLGQTDPQVKFVSHGAGYTLFLTDSEAVFSFESRSRTKKPKEQEITGEIPQLSGNILNRPTGHKQLSPAILRVKLLESGTKPIISAQDELAGKTNYIRGNDPTKWTTNVSTYSKVRYSNVFDGIDLVYYGNQGHLEYDFAVSAGANPNQIGMDFSGARAVRIEPQTGDLMMTVGKENVRFHRPIAYQFQETGSNAASNQATQLIAANYVIKSHNRVGFELGSYNHGKPLVIDPTLSYSTYLGGSSNDYATAIAVDAAGDAYVTGYTNSVNFPTTTGAYQTTCGGGCSGTTTDAFVSKLNPTGSALIYSTYLGGSSNDIGNGIALDSSGDAYIAGQTFSSNFPIIKGAFQSKCGGNSCTLGEGFITELNPEGSALIYSTYLGGAGANQANAIVLDASNNAYITGYTTSTSFPVTPGAFQQTCKCAASHPNVFATKLNATGSALVYSTYLGGTGGDEGYSIALDSADNAYLTGYTHSTNFPITAGAFQTQLAATTAAFVTKLNSTGSTLGYSTYLGGANSFTTPCEACGTAIAVDSVGNAYVCGLTAEANFPIIPGAFQSTFMSGTNGHDAFITKVNAAGNGLIFSTFLGGTGDDGATAIAVDASGNTWVRGNTKSTNFPISPGAYQTALAGLYDAFLSEVNPNGSQLLYSSYLGGTGTEYGGATAELALDTQNPPNVYITGYTNSTNFPVIAGSLQTNSGGDNDGFVSKFEPSPNVGLSAGLNFGDQNDGVTSAPQTITVTNTGNTNLSVNNVTISGANAGDFQQTNNCSTVAAQATCAINVTFTPSATGTENATVSITDNALGSPQQASLTGVGVGSGPAAVLSATSLTFPVQLVGTQSKAQTVTLSNVGNATLTISQIAVTTNFLQTNTCGTSVAVGASCTISVTFNPTVPNAITGAVTITDNASNSPQSVALNGTGTVVALTPSTINFGSVAVGQSSAPRVATLKNASTAALAIQITMGGTDPADFPETNTCGTSIPASSTCSITVTFKPGAKGLASAVLSVTDAGGGSPQTLTLIGTGQ